MPVTVQTRGGASFVLNVFSQKNTLEDKAKINAFSAASRDALRAKFDAVQSVDDERTLLLTPFWALEEERRALAIEIAGLASDAPDLTEARGGLDALDARIAEARQSFKEPLEALAKRREEIETAGDVAMHEAFARELEFFVSSIELSENGKQMEPSFEVFRNRFPFTMLEDGVKAISAAFGDFPLATPATSGA